MKISLTSLPHFDAAGLNNVIWVLQDFWFLIFFFFFFSFLVFGFWFAPSFCSFLFFRSYYYYYYYHYHYCCCCCCYDSYYYCCCCCCWWIRRIICWNSSGQRRKGFLPRLVHKSFPWHTFCHCHYCCYYYYYYNCYYCYYCCCCCCCCYCCISQSKETRNKFIWDWNLLSFLLLLLRFLPRLLPLASIVNLLLLLPQRVLTPAGVQTAWFCDFSVGTTAILISCSGITLPLSRIGFFSSIGSEASLWWKGSLAQVLDSLGGKNMVGTFFTFHYSLILSLWLPLWLLVSSSVAGTNWCHFKD